MAHDLEVVLVAKQVILSTCYLYFLHAICSLEVQELKRREMLIFIFPMQLSLHLIISLEKPARPLSEKTAPSKKNTP